MSQPQDQSHPFGYLYLASMCVGLQSIIDQKLPAYGKRVRVWRDNLYDEYRLRAVRDGENVARVWVLAQLVTPQLPDLRPGKSLADDRLLIAQYGALQRALAPVFKACPSNLYNRNMKAAPIVSRILGRTLSSANLPMSRTVGRFCRELLNAKPQLLARARRRIKDADRKTRSRTMDYFTRAISSGNKTPNEIDRLQKALDLLK